MVGCRESIGHEEGYFTESNPFLEPSEMKWVIDDHLLNLGTSSDLYLIYSIYFHNSILNLLHLHVTKPNVVSGYKGNYIIRLWANELLNVAIIDQNLHLCDTKVSLSAYKQ